MAKILVIGVGSSQEKVIERLQQSMPDSRCVLVGSDLYTRNPNIEYYSFTKNSNRAHEILELGCMPGSAHTMIVKHLSEIIEEQMDKLRDFLRFNVDRP